MTIALLSDIHGNLPALEAVLEEVDKQPNIKSIISLGDVAGYYPMINECIELLRERDVINLKGNHDHYLVTNTSCQRSTTVDKTIEFQRKVITQDNLNWLDSSLDKFETKDVSMRHGGWKNAQEEYIYKLRESYFSILPYQWFFVGHTHVQIVHKFLNGQTFCNPGSVGQPRDGDARAAFALFDGESITLKRLEYNVTQVANQMSALGFEFKLYSNLYSGTRVGGRIDKIYY